MKGGLFDVTRPWPFGLSRTQWRLVSVLSVLVIALAFLVDHSASAWAVTLPSVFREVAEVVTDLGDSTWVLLPALILFALCGGLGLLIPKRIPKLALLQMAGVYAFVFVGVGLPSLVASILKRVVGRSRPELFDSVGTLGFQHLFNDFEYQSFPSGHTATGFAIAFTVAFLSPRLLPWGLLLAVAIGLSRLLLGVHYPSDILGGAFLGTIGAYGVRNVFAWRGWVFRRTGNSIRMREWSAVKRLVRGQKPQRAAA